MYIAPNSTIELFKNLKLDNSYANTMWFTNASAQNTFFVNHRFTQLNNYSYQRKDIGVIRVEGTVSSLYDVNYMRFKNTSFENKWFYAFVTNVEYINNVTVNMYYTIDVIQTYMFDWQLHQCLIERQHSTTDVAGDNLEIEGLEIGDAICDGAYTAVVWSNFSVFMGVACSDDTFGILSQLATTGYYSGEDTYGYAIVNGIPTGVPYFEFEIDDSEEDPLLKLRQALGYLQTQNQIDSVVFIIYAPSNIFDISDDEPVEERILHSKPTSLNGYTPINKKLLTYPYCYLSVYNDQNVGFDMRYELFTNNNCNFTMFGMLNSSPECVLIPDYYDSNYQDISYALSISGFPFVGYANDGYKAWLALNYDATELNREIANKQYDINMQELAVAKGANAANTAIGVGASIFGGASNINHYLEKPAPPLSKLDSSITGQVISTGFSASSNMASGIENVWLNQLKGKEIELNKYNANQKANIAESVAKKIPNSPKNGSNCSSLALKKKGFYLQNMSIRRRFAEKVDKYFTMFGYAQNIVGIPNIHVRQNFTYIKTSGSCVSGSIPQDDRNVIDAVFDRGIRFWTNYDNFENYNVTNTIIS